MRVFLLENQYGERFHFTYFNKVLLTGVNGLGFSKNYSYLKHDIHYTTLKNNFELSEIKAVITFLDGYHGYYKFMQFLEKGQHDLKLFYESHDVKYCYVDIVHLSKSELKAGGLQSEIVLNKKSYWIKEHHFMITANVDGGGKVYPYSYEFTYANASQGVMNTQIGGHLKANMIIEITGAMEEPELIVKQNDLVKNHLRLLINRQNSQIIVSSLIHDLSMVEVVDGIAYDIYQFQDFEKDNFLSVEPGSVAFEFKPGVPSSTTCKIKIYEYYLG